MHCYLSLLLDLTLIATSTIFALILRDNLEASPDRILQIIPYLLLTLSVAVPVLLAASLNRALWRFSRLADYLRITVAVIVTVLLAVAAGFILNRMEGVARSLPILQGLLMVCTLTGVRVGMRLRHTIRDRNRILATPLLLPRETILVVGINTIAELFLRCVEENTGDGVKVAGLLAGAHRQRGRRLGLYPILGVPEELEKILNELAVHGVVIDRIVIATKFDWLPSAAQEALLHIERTSSIRLDSLSERLGLSKASPNTTPACNDGNEADPFALDPKALALRPYLRWKRVLDVVGAIVLIVCLAPVMLLVGLFVVLDVGYPPIFWQQRPGVLGWPIKLFKFRTMGAAHDHRGRHLADAERISIVGRFLRCVRLDELPQLYNILIGQMSFVGPRPLLAADQAPGSAARLAIRPGLTGWAQIKGGRDLSSSDKAALDIWYVKNASLRLDITIFLGTLSMVLFGERTDPDAIRQAWREVGRDLREYEQSRPQVTTDTATPILQTASVAKYKEAEGTMRAGTSRVSMPVRDRA